MNETGEQASAKRPALIFGAAALLLVLLLLALGAALLPGRAPALLASGLESSAERIEEAFAADVGPELRDAVRAELAAQAAWLRELPALELPAAEARAAAAPAERLSDFLADERLDLEECRSFLELGRRSRLAQP